MDRESGILRRRRALRAQRTLRSVRAEVALANAAACAMRRYGVGFDDASGIALEVGVVEHWDSIEHIEYGNYVNEFEIGGGNAFGPGSGYDWTGEQR